MIHQAAEIAWRFLLVLRRFLEHVVNTGVPCLLMRLGMGVIRIFINALA